MMFNRVTYLLSTTIVPSRNFRKCIIVQKSLAFSGKIGGLDAHDTFVFSATTSRSLKQV